MNRFAHLAVTLIAISPLGCDLRSSSGSVAIEQGKPAFAVDKLQSHYYDGIRDDLATAGLGLEGLREPLPAFVDPQNPTTQELRRSAIYHNYNHLLTLNAIDGYGDRMAPRQKARAKGVAGYEYILPVRYADQSIAAVHMVQVPDSFDPGNPCIIAAPSSGSRGVYGAIGVVGAWGLAHHCAVAYTDKGTGTGFDWLDQKIQLTVTGVPSKGGGDDVHFSVKRDKALKQFTEQLPHRVATKHAHNPHLTDKEWGTFVLQSIQLGFYILNQHHAQDKTYTRENTLVVAAGISNGGGSVLRAAEQDSGGWIDAVVASEPALNLPENFSFELLQGGKTDSVVAHDLLDQATLNALFLPCAVLAIEQPLMGEALLPIWKSRLQTRCQLLHQSDLLKGETTATQAQEALAVLRNHGMLADAAPLALLSVSIYLWEAIAVNYANSYGGYSVSEHLCDISYAYVNAEGSPVAMPPTIIAGVFGTSSGIVPTGGISLINDTSNGSPKVLLFSKNARNEDDLAFDNMLCLRRAWQSKKVQHGIAETRVSGDLQSKPTIIVHGRSDNLIHVNSNSRPYIALNQQREGRHSKLHYYEVSHGQHFDNLLQIPTLRGHFIPLHYYFESALNDMLKHLRKGEPLSPSQVVPARPAEAVTEALGEHHLPDISDTPKQPITITRGILQMP